MKTQYVLPTLLILVFSISLIQAAEPVVATTLSEPGNVKQLTSLNSDIRELSHLMPLPAIAGHVRAGETIHEPIHSEDHPEGYMKKSDMLNLYNKGIEDARDRYEGHKSAGLATLVSSSLILPMGIISAADQSSPGYRDHHFNAMNPELKQNPAYTQGFNEEALKMRKKSAKKNLIIGTAIQAAILTGLGSLLIHSGNIPVNIGMSGF